MERTRLCLLFAAIVVLPLALARTPAPATDGGWPKEVTSDGAHVVIYQHQVDSWKKDRLEARAAVTVTPSGSSTQRCLCGQGREGLRAHPKWMGGPRQCREGQVGQCSSDCSAPTAVPILGGISRD